MQSIYTDRQRMLGSLKGQVLHVPDIDGIFAGWPKAFNPELENLRCDVDDRLQRIVEDRYTHKSEQALALKKLKAPNYALLGAYWWPFVDEKTLHTMTYLAIWIALWDDVFEREASTMHAGTLADDWQHAQAYRHQTLHHVRQSLKLPSTVDQERSDNVLITTFDDVAAHVNEVCSDEQKELLYVEIEQHVLATAEKQRLRLTSEVPSLKEYLDIRMRSSGVRVCATALEMCHKNQISLEIREDANVKKLLDQVNIMVLVTNDMCSFKSKIARGSVDNLVALLWLSQADVDSAVSIAASVLEAARNDFDATAEQLIADYMVDDTPRPDLQELISACQAVCTGNLVWSRSIRGYGYHIDERDNSRTVVI